MTDTRGFTFFWSLKTPTTPKKSEKYQKDTYHPPQKNENRTFCDETKITNTVFPCEIRQQNFARYHGNCSQREELEHKIAIS